MRYTGRVVTLPAFGLRDLAGRERHFPSGAPSLLVFVKEDCPTCALSAPIVEAVARQGELDVVVVAQDARPFGSVATVLDDSALAVSYGYGIETVPTAIVTDGDGLERARFVGFDRERWRALFPTLDLAWADYPVSRPGCGSRSVEPDIAERLEAAASGSRLQARRIEIGDATDPFEFTFEQGLTDGLPVVPPTPERVLRMLSGTRRDPREVVAVVPPNMGEATVEKVAINAVMAGCKPEYLPVVIAAVQAACTDAFNIHGVLATTHFVGPVIIVNGPVRDRIGMNYRENALGQGSRANATIGRALQLVIRNVGGGRPGEIDRAALGQPGKYTFCFAEHEARSNWDPLHVELGFAAEDSVVTLFAGGAPTGFVDQLARDARSLATSYGLMLASATHPKQYGYGEIIVIVSPEHVDTFAKDGWTKAQVREQIQRATLRPARELVRDEWCAEGMTPAEAERIGLDTPVPKFAAPENVKLIVAGGEAGKFGAYIMAWGGGGGSRMTSVKIEE